jgi:LysM repeat protein
VIWGDAPSAGFAVREPPLRASGDGIPERKNWSIKSHTVRRGESVASIARRYGVTTAQLAEWNGITSDKLAVGKRIYVSAPSEGIAALAPVVVAVVEPPSAAPTRKALLETELIADAEGEPAVAAPAVARSSAASRPDFHRVHKGETLIGLAARYQVDVEDLRAWNHLPSDRVRTGARLRLHGGDVARAGTPGPVEKPAPTARIVHLSSNLADDPITRVHRIAPGETLESIARQYGVAVSSLKILNRLRNSRIIAGQKMSIPASTGVLQSLPEDARSPEPVPTLVDRPPTVRYVVRAGDSLYSIARERATTVDTLMLINGLRDAGIRAGQVLEVPTVASR